jgi:thiamine pyrophosphokinase
MPAKGVGLKAIVVAGGDAAPEDAALLPGAGMVIAADSGADWVASHGALPDLVIGDMDSIDPALLERLTAQGAAVEAHPAEKDASDAELAVARAVAAGADEIVILGGLRGERLDHELANLLLLADVRWEGIDLRIERAGTTVRCLKGGSRVELTGVTGDLVTLLPLGVDAEGIRTEGLRYALDDETLAAGRSRGLSNEVVEAPASVSLKGGTLLVIETRKEPSA